MLEILRNWPTFQTQTNLSGPFTEDDWLVEVEARPTIVIYICLRFDGGMKTLSRHSHTVTIASMPSTCAKIIQVLASISAQAKPEGLLAEKEWLVGTEARPTIVPQACVGLAVAIEIGSYHSHSNTNPSVQLLCARTNHDFPTSISSALARSKETTCGGRMFRFS